MDKILVIEDEDDLREELRDLLIYERFSVQCASDGESGWPAAQDRQRRLRPDSGPDRADRRLLQLYGYVMEIDSVPGRYTQVEVTMAAV